MSRNKDGDRFTVLLARLLTRRPIRCLHQSTKNGGAMDHGAMAWISEVDLVPHGHSIGFPQLK